MTPATGLRDSIYTVSKIKFCFYLRAALPLKVFRVLKNIQLLLNLLRRFQK